MIACVIFAKCLHKDIVISLTLLLTYVLVEFEEQ